MAYKPSEGICDQCGNEIEDGDRLACDDCHTKLEDELEEALNTIRGLRDELSELEAELEEETDNDN